MCRRGENKAGPGESGEPESTRWRERGEGEGPVGNLLFANSLHSFCNFVAFSNFSSSNTLIFPSLSKETVMSIILFLVLAIYESTKKGRKGDELFQPKLK